MRLKRTARFSSRRLQRFRVMLGEAEQAQGGAAAWLAGAISDE
jgi:hypothetical protein